MDLAELRQKIGQSFIIGFDQPEPSDDVKKFITTNNIGGVILFDRNIETPAQVGDLTNELQSLVPKRADRAPLLVSIDMEGGRVARLKAPFTQWPPMKILGEIGSAALGFKFAETMGKELLAVGINLNFSPCVDVLTNEQNTVIGDRAFGNDPEVVSKMSSALVRGFVKSGIIPCVKHFPGHGDTVADSHEELPVVNHSLDRLDKIEFVPFKKAFRARADLVMTAHIKMTQIDSEWPATLSPKILQEILRGRLGFRNAIISDDMEMKAISKNYGVEQAAVQAMAAGCNLLMYCYTISRDATLPQKALEAIVKAVADGKLSQDLIEKNYQTVMKLKKDNLKPFAPVDVTAIGKIIGHPEHLKLAKHISRKEIPAGLAT